MMRRVFKYDISTNPAYESQNIFSCVNTETQEILYAKVIPHIEEEKPQLEVLKILKEEYHMHIVKIYDICYHDDNHYVIMEHFEQNLEQYLRSSQYDIKLISDIITQILECYKYLQKFQIVMRNLSLNSISVKQVYGRFLLKIVDFNFSHTIGQKVSRIPKSIYTAPEILEEQQYSDKCDVYSLGIILYQLCYKEQPYQIDNIGQFHSSIKLNSFHCPQNQQVDQYLKLLQAMLIYQQQKRISWETLYIQPQFAQQFLIWQDEYLIDFTNKISQCQQQEATFFAINLQTQQPFEAKAFSTTEKDKVKNRKMEIYKKLQGHQIENIIQIKEVICRQFFYYFILEKGTMSLDEYLKIKVLNNNEIIDFAKQIINGFNFLKSKNVIHRDLNLDNIVVKIDEHGKVVYKITNFETEKPQNKRFKAPELFSLGCDDSNCDVFSFGLILYFIIEKKHFFEFTKIDELIKAQECLDNSPLSCPSCQDPTLRELIPQMVCHYGSRINWEKLISSPLFPENNNNKNSDTLQSKSTQHADNKNISAWQQNGQIVNAQNLNPDVGSESKFTPVSETYFLKTDSFGQNSYQLYSGNLQQQNNNQLTYQQVIDEISIGDYLLAILYLQINLLKASEQCYKMQDQGLVKQVGEYNSLLIQFCFHCRSILVKLLNNQTVEINQFSFNPIYQKQQFQQELDSIYQQLIEILNSNQIILTGKESYQDQDLEQKENNIDILQDHTKIKQFYLSFRQHIQNPEITIKYRYYLERTNNLFEEFPIKNPLRYFENDINPKELSNDQMELYLSQQQFL